MVCKNLLQVDLIFTESQINELQLIIISRVNSSRYLVWAAKTQQMHLFVDGHKNMNDIFDKYAVHPICIRDSIFKMSNASPAYIFHILGVPHSVQCASTMWWSEYHMEPEGWSACLESPHPSQSAGIILCMHPTNGRRRYIVTSSLIGWTHSQKDPWVRAAGTGRSDGSDSRCIMPVLTFVIQNLF